MARVKYVKARPKRNEPERRFFLGRLRLPQAALVPSHEYVLLAMRLPRPVEKTPENGEGRRGCFDVDQGHLLLLRMTDSSRA